MTAQLIAQTKFTIKEYLKSESEADIKHEFINGEIIPMAGGTTNHNEIITNLCVILKPLLRKQKSRIYTENVKLWIPSFQVFTYPDVMIMEGESIYYQDTKTTVTNPLVIIEVLSESTRDYDLGRKFGYYRSLETLHEYILIEPEQYSIMVYRRDTHKKWLLEISDNISDTLFIQAINLQIPLSEVYQ